MDSQIGPSTRAGRSGSRGSARAVDGVGRGRARARSAPRSGAARRTAPAGSARSCPASRTTWRPAAVADVEDAGDQPAGTRDEGPAGLDRQAARAGGRRGRPRAAPAAPGRTAPARATAGPSGRTGNPPPRSSVSNVSIDRATARPARAPCGRRRATRRPRRAATRRGGGCRAGGADRRGRRRPRWPPPISVSAIPNLAAPAPTARPACVSGVDVRVEPVQDVEAEPGLFARRDGEARAPAASSGDSSATQRSGSSVRGGPGRGPQVGAASCRRPRA